MKKWLFLVVCACVVSFAKADNDKVITFEQLPAAARTFIQRHFPSEKVAFVKAERDWLDTSYDVHFINGSELEFDKSGEWKELDCRRQAVPEGAVPAAISKFVKESYPDARIQKIERDRYEYEVRLSNFMEVKFDLSFNVIDIDFDD